MIMVLTIGIGSRLSIHLKTLTRICSLFMDYKMSLGFLFCSFVVCNIYIEFLFINHCFTTPSSKEGRFFLSFFKHDLCVKLIV